MDFSDADKQKLRDAFSVKASLNGNLLTFIGLDEIRDRFPGMWNQHRKRIVATSKAILQQFTDPSADIVLPVGDANFVVLFTRLGKDESLLRAGAIKAEILRRFMGDEALEGLDIHTHAMELDSGSVTKGVLGELLALSARTEPADPRRRSAAKQQALPDATPPPCGTTPRQPVDGVPFGGADAGLSRSVDELEAQFAFNLDDVDFAFQPLLYVKRSVFSVFSCRAVRYSATRDILVGYDVLPREASAEEVAALDRMTLLRARHGLVDMAMRKRVAVVASSVSFETMTGRATATEYLDMLQKVPSDLRNYLVLNLTRCPVGVLEGRLAEIVNPLRRLARAVFVHVTSGRQPLAVIKGAGAFGAGLALPHRGAGELGSPAFLQRFVATARKLGLHSYILDVDSREQLVLCRRAGFDYVAGRALAELSDHVGPVTEVSVA